MRPGFSIPWLLLALVLAAKSAAAQGRQSLTVTIVAQPEARAELERTLRRVEDIPYEVQLVPLPSAAALEASGGDVEVKLAAARAAYVEANFDSCIGDFADSRADIGRLLRRRQRKLATRYLFWHTACLIGAAREDDAGRVARRFASLGFEIPDEADVVSPEVEMMLAGAMRDRGQSVRVRILSEPSGAVVQVDGHDSLCRTPCSADLPPGGHHVEVSGDGLQSVSKWVQVPAEKTVRLRLPDAPPEVAARQWTERYSAADKIDSPPSLELLARATRSRRLIVLSAQPANRRLRMRGALVVDGRVSARAERKGSAAKAPGVLRDLLVQAKLIEEAPLYKKASFWGVVGLTAAAAAGVTFLLVREENPRTELGF